MSRPALYFRRVGFACLARFSFALPLTLSAKLPASLISATSVPAIPATLSKSIAAAFHRPGQSTDSLHVALGSPFPCLI